ncbi:MAG: DUF4167 domain-containing protein [Alphaproteobacteria bacterium]|nr:DUF4167 domain-containing protein [Alphaproteobacteria bacterium]
MRQNNSRRSRGRNGRKQGNPRTQIFDSNGPSVRIRGHAVQIFEKYQQLSRDASSAGDRVGAENLQQHAEHYYRLASAAGAIAGSETAQGDADGIEKTDNTQRNGAGRPAAERSAANGHGAGNPPKGQTATGKAADTAPGDTGNSNQIVDETASTSESQTIVEASAEPGTQRDGANDAGPDGGADRNRQRRRGRRPQSDKPETTEEGGQQIA